MAEYVPFPLMTPVSLCNSCGSILIVSMSQFEAIITAALGSSNEQRKAAEQALESLKQQPDAFIASLSHVLSTAADPSVRVLAGVLLRQQLDIRQQCWDKASEPARLHVRGQLLQVHTSL
jgi:hypothetical protein